MSTSSSSSTAPAIVWFRDELRLADNRALHAAAGTGGPVVALFVFDEESPGIRPLGGASRWWLHHSLAALSNDLTRIGGRLTIREGAAARVVPAVARACGARLVTWSRRYGKAERDIDSAVAAALKAAGVAVEVFCDRLLAEPWSLHTQSGSPFRVFTPFYRALTQRAVPAPPLPAPSKIQAADVPEVHVPAHLGLDDLGLLPRIPWDAGMAATWQPGEAGAHRRLEAFLEHGLNGYAAGRDRLRSDATSRLSPHLRFGEIGPRQIWHRVQELSERKDGPPAEDRAKFLSEIGWREFSYHLLGYNPDLATRNFSARFDAFPWKKPDRELAAWKQGKTGIPIVDAGMRELWHTGYMHNRVRMITASFLVKHLLIDWREGERWFWDTLVDADPANNPASWQWVAGSGADAAPYFRVFNPVLQAAKFDPEGAYIRRWVPELAHLRPPHLFEPWKAPPLILQSAGVSLGTSYPRPLVDLDEGRRRALGHFAELPGT